jgi:hypothetical protein
VSHASRHKPYDRRLRVLLPCIVLLLGALAAVTWADNAVNRGVTYLPTPPPIAWADQRLGVNAYNIQFEPNKADVTRTLELARDMGAHFVRMQMPWDDVEIHGKGDFEDRRDPQHVHSAWEKYDFIFAEMSRLGLEPIVRLDRPPGWARAQADVTPAFQAGLKEIGNSTGPPDNFAEYADFAGAVAARYRDRVRFYQIWNEPNLAYEWNWVLPQPERFVDLLRLGAQAIKAANPNAVILFPSLSPTDGLEPRIAPLTELEYLDRVYKAGGGRYFDIMSAQAYGLGQPPDEHRYIFLRGRNNDWVWTRPIDTRNDVSRVVLLREVMELHGDGGKAVWISEFGYVSESPTVPPERRNTWGTPVTEDQKADYIIGQIERARREWPWVGVMNVWFLRWGGYQEPNPQDPTPNFAIVDRDFKPRPAYEMIKSYMAQAPASGVGAHAWDHPAVERRGATEWAIRFAGTSFALYNLKAPLSVAVDGGMSIKINPLIGSGTLTITAGLPDRVHTAIVQGNSAPEGFLIGREPLLPWFWALAPALIVIGLALTGALSLRALFERFQR